MLQCKLQFYKKGSLWVENGSMCHLLFKMISADWYVPYSRRLVMRWAAHLPLLPRSTNGPWGPVMVESKMAAMMCFL